MKRISRNIAGGWGLAILLCGAACTGNAATQDPTIGAWTNPSPPDDAGPGQDSSAEAGPGDSGVWTAANRPAADATPAAASPAALLAISQAYSRTNETDPLLRFDFDDAQWGLHPPNLAPTSPRAGLLVGGAKLTDQATQGHVGRALLLDGVDDHLVVPSPTMLDGLTDQLTVQAWVYADNLTTSLMRIVSRWSVSEQKQRSFSLSVYEKRPYFVVSSDGENAFSAHSMTEIQPRVWTHLAAVCDGKYLRIYIDKQLDRSVALPEGFAFGQRSGNLVIGNRDETESGQRWVGMIDEVYVYGVARSTFGRTYRVTVPSFVKVGAPFDIAMAVVQEDGMPLTSAAETLLLSEPDDAVTLPNSSWTFTPAQGGVQHLSGAVCRKAGIRRLVVQVRGEAITAESNPFYCADALPDGRQLIWGDMHWHSNLGWGSPTTPHATGNPEDGYRFARDVSMLDFTAMSEHAFRLKTPSADWLQQVELANRFHAPGRFVTLLGYEWRGDGAPSTTPWGHHIVRFPGFDPAGVTDPSQETAAEVRYAAGVNVPSIAIPGALYTSAMTESPAPWDFARDDTRELPNLWRNVAPYWATVTPHHLGLQRLDSPQRYPAGSTPYLEVYSKWGASEMRGMARPTYAQAEGGPLAQDALRAGFKVGFVGGSDTHLTTPGASTIETAENLQYHHPGLTACLVPAKTRKALWQALVNRRCYATSDQRILVMFSLNGAAPGSQITLPQDSAPVIDVVAAGTTKLKIELLRDSGVIRLLDPDAAIGGFRYVDTSRPRAETFYYVRVTQVDGERAWVSPIWVTSTANPP